MYKGRNNGWWCFQNDHNNFIEDGWNQLTTALSLASETNSSIDKSLYILKINICSVDYEINF